MLFYDLVVVDGLFIFFLPAEGGVAMGTQASPCPVAVDAESNVLARKAEIGWTSREEMPTLKSSAGGGKHMKRKKQSGSARDRPPPVMSQRATGGSPRVTTPPQ